MKFINWKWGAKKRQVRKNQPMKPLHVENLEPRLAPALVSYLPLDDLSAGVTPDVTGNGNNAQLFNGASIVSGGRILAAASFDGSNDYAAIQNLSYNSAGAISQVSVAFWINTNDTRAGIVDFDRSEYWSVGLNFHNAGGQGGRISWDTRDQVGGIHDLNTTFAINDGNWHHIVAVFDSSQTFDKKIYVDGVLNVQADAYATGVNLGSGTTRFGFLGDGSEASSFNGGRNGVYFDGLLDDVRIYDHALTAAEVTALFNSPVAKDDTYQTNPGSTLTVTVANGVLQNDVDPNLDPITATKLTDPANGTLTFNSDGSFTYTPNPGFVGFDSFTYAASDGTYSSNTATVDLIVRNPIPSEVGKIITDQTSSAQWHTVNLTNTYTNPVVVMAMETANGSDPVTLRVRNVTSTSFEFQIDEWDYLDGIHATETISYWVVESGQYVFANGSVLMAGTATVNQNWTTVNFPSAFSSTPVVLSQTSTVNESDAVTTRQRNVGTGSFQIRLQEEEGNPNSHANETVGWIAFEQFVGTGLAPFESGATPNSVTHNWFTVNFTETFSSTPAFLAQMQTYDGGDTATVRERNASTTSAQVRIEEEQSANAETNHTTEVVGYAALEVGNLLLFRDNQAPTDINLSNNTVAENQPTGTLVGTLSTVDPDVGDTHTYALVSGPGSTDNALFQIVGNQLQTNAVLNFEAKSTLSIRVQTRDAEGFAFEKVFTITVTDNNDLPTDINLSNNTVAENQPVGTVVGTFSTVDEDAGDTFTYALVSGPGDTDNGSFAIVGDQLQTNAVFDFETQNTFSIRVRTTDAGGLTFDKIFTITVTNVNEAPDRYQPVQQHRGREPNPSARSSAHSRQWMWMLGTRSPMLWVSGPGDTDNASFAIVGDQLQTNAVFDFETQNTFSIRVRTTDAGGLTFDKIFTITVTNVNEAPTDINLSNDTVAENQPVGTVVGTFSTVDEDAGDTFTYALVSGLGDTDNASFVIVGDQLQTNAVFDFETQNTFSIRVRTTDAGGLTFEKVFTITVTNVNEAPTDINLSNNRIPENSPVGTVVGVLSATDEDAGGSHTYALVSGPGDSDNSLFLIVGNQLVVNGSLDFETNSSLSIRVQVTDQAGLTFERVFTIAVTDVPEQPEFDPFFVGQLNNLATPVPTFVGGEITIAGPSVPVGVPTAFLTEPFSLSFATSGTSEVTQTQETPASEQVVHSFWPWMTELEAADSTPGSEHFWPWLDLQSLHEGSDYFWPWLQELGAAFDTLPTLSAEDAAQVPVTEIPLGQPKAPNGTEVSNLGRSNDEDGEVPLLHAAAWNLAAATFCMRLGLYRERSATADEIDAYLAHLAKLKNDGDIAVH
ncbi:MAG: hypothetical protein KatS3mg105_0289 [Gemmatales bacterium]|nr:MAG: hypothetical protein KatS3mg105_0289 [Gemmatales bacterium]